MQRPGLQLDSRTLAAMCTVQQHGWMYRRRCEQVPATHSAAASSAKALVARTQSLRCGYRDYRAGRNHHQIA